MSALVLLLLLIGIGVALYFIPMEPGIKRIAVIAIGVVVAVVLIIWVLQITGVGTGPRIRIG